MGNIYEEVEILKNTQDIISRAIKTQSLNTLSFKLNTLSSQTTSEQVKEKIQSILTIIEDAYNIDMYKFQFKILSELVSKEISIIEDIVTIGNV